MPKVVIAAGGTAGHVVPALAVADALRASGAEVEFVGGERAEAELVPAAGIRFHRPRAWRASTGATRCGRRARPRWRCAATGERAAAAEAHRRRRRAGRRRLRGGAGGPGGADAAAAARAHRGRQPPGRHQPAAGAARPAGVPGVSDRGPRRRQVRGGRAAGARRAPVGADRAAARARFGIAEDEPCVLVFGGSLGARRLNEAALAAFGEAAPCAVLHASGRRDHADLVQRLAALGSPAALPPPRLRRALRRRPGGRRPGGRPGGRLGARGGRSRAALDPRSLPARDRRPPDA